MNGFRASPIHHSSFIIHNYLQYRIERNELVAEAVLDSLTERVGMLFLKGLVIVHRRKIELDGVGRSAVIEFGQQAQNFVARGEVSCFNGGQIEPLHPTKPIGGNLISDAVGSVIKNHT